jgi:acyl carrier protein
MDQSTALLNRETTLQPDTADTLTKVRELLQERYDIDQSKVEMDTDLSALGLDSLSLAEYAFDLEKYLHIALSDLPHEVATVGDLVRFVTDVRRRTGASVVA